MNEKRNNDFVMDFKVPSKSMDFLGDQAPFKQSQSNFAEFGEPSKKKFNNASVDNILMANSDSQNWAWEPCRTPVHRPVNAGTLTASNNFLLDGPQQSPKPKWKPWQKFWLSLLLALIAGLVAVFVIYFVAKVKNIWTLLAIFVSITVALLLVFNARNCKAIAKESYHFMGLVQGNVCVVLLITAAILLGPVSSVFEHQTQTCTAVRQTNEREDTIAVFARQTQDAGHFFDVDSLARDVHREVDKFEIGLNYISRDFDHVLDYCAFALNEVENRGTILDKESQCLGSDKERLTSQLEVQVRAGSSKTSGSDQRNQQSTLPADPIWRIIDIANEEIENHRKPSQASAQTSQTENDVTKDCPCCSQLSIPFQNFCRYLTKQKTKFNSSTSLAEFWKDLDNLFRSSLKDQAVLMPRQSSLVDAKPDPRTPIGCLNFGYVVNWTAVGLVFLALLLALSHVVIRPSKVTEVKSCQDRKSELACVTVLVLLGILINVSGTILASYCQKENPDTNNDASSFPESFNCSAKLIGTLLVGWSLLLVQTAISATKFLNYLVQNRRSNHVQTNLANNSGEVKIYNAPNALNYNITYPASPKLSKCLNVCENQVALTNDQPRSMTLPFSSSYV